MIVLDTNVLSELMRARPEPAVVAWVGAQAPSTLYTTCINEAEILFGLRAMPNGKRRENLVASAAAIFREDLSGRVLPLTSAAAAHYADIVVTRRRAGNPIEGFDALIAAIARASGSDIATRDVGGFEGCGLKLLNPWLQRPD